MTTASAGAAPSVTIEITAANRNGRRAVTLDLIAVERVLRGENPAILTPPERREAIRQALELGWSWPQVYERLRAGGQTIRRALEEPISLLPA